MIRKTEVKDAKIVAEIYAKGREYMKANGFEQWINGYPSIDDVMRDIQNGVGYLLEDNEGIYGAFAMIDGEDPTYSYIENGEWISDSEYLTLHRVVSSGRKSGIMSEICDFARQHNNHLRIDTHKDNIKMQNAILKNGFSHRGTIYLLNGNPRLAYEQI